MKTPLSDKEVHAALQKLNDRVFDLKFDEPVIRRFLKYNNFNVDKAEDSLRKSLEWRKTNKVSSFLTWKPPREVQDDFKFEFLGEDKDGHSVIYLPIGGWQTKKVMDMGFKTEAFQFRYHLLEKIMQVVEKSKREKFLMIMDMEGLTYKKCLHYETIQLLTASFKDFEENYPERLRACYVINAPWAFSYIYSILKHVFSSKTLNKAKIFDDDETKWKPILLDAVSDEIVQKIKTSENSRCSE